MTVIWSIFGGAPSPASRWTRVRAPTPLRRGVPFRARINSNAGYRVLPRLLAGFPRLAVRPGDSTPPPWWWPWWWGELGKKKGGKQHDTSLSAPLKKRPHHSRRADAGHHHANEPLVRRPTVSSSASTGFFFTAPYANRAQRVAELLRFFSYGGGLHWTLRNGREAVALFVYRIFNWDFPDLAQLNAAKQLLFGSSQLMAASPCKWATGGKKHDTANGLHQPSRPTKEAVNRKKKRDMQIFSIRGEKQSRKKNIGKNPERK